VSLNKVRSIGLKKKKKIKKKILTITTEEKKIRQQLN
jgi:hypothetical protein